jgi:hypothetical protein
MTRLLIKASKDREVVYSGYSMPSGYIATKRLMRNRASLRSPKDE